MEKRPPKTIKEKKFVKEYTKTGNATEAAARVYNVKNRNVAKAIGNQQLTKLDIGSVLDKAGLTNAKIASILVEAAEATRAISAIVGTKATGQTVDFVDVPDWAARLKAIDMAANMKNLYPPKKLEVAAGGQDMIETWKKELGIDAQNISDDHFRDVDMVDVPKEALPLSEADSTPTTEGLSAGPEAGGSSGTTD